MSATFHARMKLPPGVTAACSEVFGTPGAFATLSTELQPWPALRMRASMRPERIQATMRSPCALIATAGEKAPGDETFVALPNFPPEGRSIVDTPLPPASKSTIDWPEWLAAATN